LADKFIQPRCNRIHKKEASSSVSCYKLKIDSTSLSTLLPSELNTNSDMVTQVGNRKRTSMEIYYHYTMFKIPTSQLRKI